jgi:hypothetical protein
MAAQNSRRTSEWVGGLFPMPAYITGEGEPFRPEMLIWMANSGEVLGNEVGRPGELLAQARQSLQRMIEQPPKGKTVAPKRVRVASPELAEALRFGDPFIEIVCAATPELDGLLADMAESLVGDQLPSFLSPFAGPEGVGAFFRAAAEFYRAAPWELVPSDKHVFSVSIPQYGIHQGVLSVFGQMGECCGLALFSSMEDFLEYPEAVEAHQQGKPRKVPRQFAIAFTTLEELSPLQQSQIEEFRWEVAGDGAIPLIWANDEDMVMRPITERDLQIGETLALAASWLPEKKKMLGNVWFGATEVRFDLHLTTHLGETLVILLAPYRNSSTPEPAPTGQAELLAIFRRLQNSGISIPGEELHAMQEQIMSNFVHSPEARPLRDIGAASLIMELAVVHQKCTIATLRAAELSQILYWAIPGYVHMDPEEAPVVIAELRAFFAFLKRELQLPQADECLQLLAGKAGKRLAAALADRKKFELEKILETMARQEGSDLNSASSIKAFLEGVKAQVSSGPGEYALVSIPLYQDPKKATQPKVEKRNPKKNKKKPKGRR